MSIIGLALYGSRARGDDDERSDFDLAAITDDPGPRTVSAVRTTISCLPYDAAHRRAAGGDLFVLHLVTEARVLYQAWPVFDELRRVFKYRDNYDREIGLASDVGWFLLQHAGDFDEARLVNRKMAWCARTIVTARAANQQRAIFSARQLVEFSGSSELPTIIRNKDGNVIDAEALRAFGAFLEAMGTTVPAGTATLEERRSQFAANRNVVGLRLVDALETQLVSDRRGDQRPSIY